MSPGRAGCHELTAGGTDLGAAGRGFCIGALSSQPPAAPHSASSSPAAMNGAAPSRQPGFGGALCAIVAIRRFRAEV